MIIVMMGVCGSGKTTVGSELAKQANIMIKCFQDSWWGIPWFCLRYTAQKSVGNSPIGCSFADADEFHSDENKRKMSQGIPLTDEDRYPWLVSIHLYMRRIHSTGDHGVVTCSALKRQYRDILRDGIRQDDVNTTTLTIASSLPQEVSSSPQEVSSLPQEVLKTSQAQCSSQEHTHAAPDQENMSNDLSNMSHRNASNSRLALKFVHLNGSAEVLQKRMERRLGHFMPPELLKSQLETLEPFHTDEDYLVTDIDRSVEDIVAEILMDLKLCAKTAN